MLKVCKFPSIQIYNHATRWTCMQVGKYKVMSWLEWTCSNLTCPDLTCFDLNFSDFTLSYFTWPDLICHDLTWPQVCPQTIQTPSNYPQETIFILSRHHVFNIQTPSRHLSDTFLTPSRHLPVTFSMPLRSPDTLTLI